MQVAENIYQVQLPLPFALRIINVYLLRDDDGWTVLDSGLHTAAAEQVWRAAFAELALDPQRIRRIVLTHYHPDHYGMAGWLQELSGAPVLMSRREIVQAEEVWGQPTGIGEPIVEHLVEHGTPREVAAAIAAEVAKLRQATLPHPVAIEELEAGAALTMGGRSFRAIHAPGHSDGQLIFYAADGGLVLAGDQVLNKITPHIGFWPNSEPDPLGRYLASLAELDGFDVRLALAGHGPLINDWRGRLAELRAHHAERLAAMRAAVVERASAYEVAMRCFPFAQLSAHEKRFAVAETIAHLEYLATSGQLRRTHAEYWLYEEV